MLELGREYDSKVGGVGVARGWSLKEGKNKCQIYTHFLTWQRSVLTKCANRVTKCRFTLLRPAHPLYLFIFICDIGCAHFLFRHLALH